MATGDGTIAAAMILSSTYPLRLETPRLLLRELRLDDWPAARAIDADPEVVRFQANRLMEQLGLQREAHLRQNWWLKGEWCDSLLFAILEEEWRPGRL